MTSSLVSRSSTTTATLAAASSACSPAVRTKIDIGPHLLPKYPGLGILFTERSLHAFLQFQYQVGLEGARLGNCQ